MLKHSWKLPLALAIAGSVCAIVPSATADALPAPLADVEADPAGNRMRQVAPVSQLTTEADPSLDGMSQLTSVSQLSDVQPTDWAFQALQSLVERYGCIAGYPDRTYRGDRALSRYEFAAGVNTCLDRMSELIASTTADLVSKDDLLALQKLQEEFAAELAVLRGRVDQLEVRTATLEQQQFSTTTKLSGTAIFAVADGFGGSGSDINTVFQYRTSLDFTTSFTGTDLLLTSLWAGNVPPSLGVGFDLPGTRVGFFDVPSAEGTLSSQFGATLDNSLTALVLGYNFFASEKLLVSVAGTGYSLNLIAPTLNPALDDSDGGTGTISVFGERNAIYSLGSGSGIGLNYFLTPQIRLSAAYLADPTFVNNPERGLFNGGYSALAQVTWSPTKQFSLAGTYINAYFPPGRFGFNYNSLAVTGTAVANTLAGQSRLTARILFDTEPVITNSYGVQATYQVSPTFIISGWFGATFARLIGEGDGTILNYALTFAFPDLFIAFLTLVRCDRSNF